MSNIVGERPSEKVGKRYANDPLRSYAEAYRDITAGLVNECGIDVYSNSRGAMLNEAAMDSLQSFFIEESYDPEEIKDVDSLEEHMSMMKEQFKNDKEALLESAPIANHNPLIGMSLPIHKFILMNCMFDKAISKGVTKSPKWSLTLERKVMIDVDGNEIDMWKEQEKIYDALKNVAPYKPVEMTIPEVETTDIVKAIGGTEKDHLDVNSYISEVFVTFDLKDGSGTKDVWVPVNLIFSPGYGENDRTLTRNVVCKASTTKDDSLDQDQVINDTVTAMWKKDRLCINTFRGKVKKVKFSAKLDTSNGLLKTPKVDWRQTTEFFEIGTANPITMSLSQVEIKDISALYQIDHVAKCMSMIKDVLGNYKDDDIKFTLDESFARLDDEVKLTEVFDMAPRDGYALDSVEWRHKMFMDQFDSWITDLLTIYNDPNMTVTVLGRTDIIRKIKPTNYSFEAAKEVGPIPLDFNRGVFTSDNRAYQFVSSQKLSRRGRKSDELTIMLKPNNTERIAYKLYDYQFVITNEMRAADNHALPAISAFDRYKVIEFQPVQGRVRIINPSGIKPNVPNKSA